MILIIERLRFYVGLAFCSLLLSACVTNSLPYDRANFEGRAVIDLGVAQEAIRHHSSCQYGRYQPGYATAYFYPCIYLESQTWAAILDFDIQQKKYIEVVHIPIQASTEVALQHFSLGDQLQITMEGRRFLIDFDGLGGGLNARAAYEHLRDAGMSVGAPVGYISARIHDPQPTPVVIPIYVPVR